MAEKYNATCSICGKPYYKCISCKDAMKLRPWQVKTCSSEHYKVSQIVCGFSTKVYTKDEAREKFKNVDLRDLDSFRPNIKNIIKDILKENKKVVKPVVEIEVEPVKEINREINEEINKPVYPRKRSLKVETDVE